MSLRKNLQDALNEAHRLKFDVVRKILDEHLRKQQEFVGGAADLASLLREYDQTLRSALSLASKPTPSADEQKTLKDSIRRASELVASCEAICSRLNKEIGVE